MPERWLFRREGHAWLEHQQWQGLGAYRNRSGPVRGDQGQGQGPGKCQQTGPGVGSISALHKYLTSVLVNTLIVKRKTRGSGHGPDGESGSSSFCQLVAGTCPQLSLILPLELWSCPREQEGHYKTPGHVGTGLRGEALTVLLAGDEGIQDARAWGHLSSVVTGRQLLV